MSVKVDTTKYKGDVRKWSRKQLNELKRNVRVLTNNEKHILIKTIRIKGTGGALKSRNEAMKLLDSLSAKVKTRFDLPERVIFPFVRHGVFIAKGVSRGHPVSNPRKKIDWFETSIDSGINELADIIVKHQADAAVKLSGDIVNKKGVIL